MTDIAIIKVGTTLLATVHEGLTDAKALSFQEQLNSLLEKSQATSVVIDLTMVATIDSFLGRLLSETALGARLLGAQTLIAGIQPAVAMTLVELGLRLDEVRTVLTTERALQILGHRFGAEEMRG
jgi:rsbT antagonist protein RsbS